jgi:hypothetical protein
LPNGQPDPWPVLDGLRENVPRLFEVIAGVQHAVDFAAVLGPLLDLVVVAVIRQEGIVGLFVGPMVIAAPAASISCVVITCQGPLVSLPMGRPFYWRLAGASLELCKPHHSISLPPSCAPLGPSGAKTREKVAHKTAGSTTLRGPGVWRILSFW